MFNNLINLVKTVFSKTQELQQKTKGTEIYVLNCLKKIRKVNKQDIKNCTIIQQHLNKYQFTKNEIDYFLANVFHETALLTKFEENLYYSTTERLNQVFPSFFKRKYESINYIKNPEKLANLVYGNRFGNTKNGDGWKYRGRGLLQLTFKDNYQKYNLLPKFDIVQNPDLMLDLNISSIVCLNYYQQRCNKTSLSEARKSIAGSNFGLNEVQKIYNKIKETKI